MKRGYCVIFAISCNLPSEVPTLLEGFCPAALTGFQIRVKAPSILSGLQALMFSNCGQALSDAPSCCFPTHCPPLNSHHQPLFSYCYGCATYFLT